MWHDPGGVRGDGAGVPEREGARSAGVWPTRVRVGYRARSHERDETTRHDVRSRRDHVISTIAPRTRQAGTGSATATEEAAPATPIPTPGAGEGATSTDADVDTGIDTSGAAHENRAR